MGKKKIAIEKISDDTKRNTTFSKRMKGIRSKIVELCLRHNAKVAMLSTSPSSNSGVYSFGYPSVSNIIHAFVANSPPVSVDADFEEFVRTQYCEIKKLERRNKAMKEQQQMMKNKFWWEFEDFENCNSVERLHAYADALEKLKENVSNKLKSIRDNKGISSSTSAGNQIMDSEGFDQSESINSPNTMYANIEEHAPQLDNIEHYASMVDDLWQLVNGN